MLKQIYKTLTKKERIVFIIALVIMVASAVANTSLTIQAGSALLPVPGGAYREGAVGQPIAINPITSANPMDLDLSALIYGRIDDILTSHETQKEGRVHVIKIKEGLKWSNGQPLTSDDVIFTIRTIQDPDTKSPLFKNWEGIVAERVSELQIRFTLQSPYAFFLEQVKKLPVIPQHIFSKIPPANLGLSGYNLAPIGSGPYKFESLTKRKDGFINEIRLVRNEQFADQPAFMERFAFSFFENEEDLIQAFRRRQVDGFGSSNPGPKIIDAQKSNTELISLPFSRIYAIFINENINPVLKNETTRAALRDALGKHALVKNVFPATSGGSIATPVEGPVITAEQTPQKSMTREEIETHISKRKEAEGEIVLTLVVPEVSFLKQTALAIKETWESVGVDKVNIITLETRDLLENVLRPNNYELLLFGVIGEIPEDIFPFWHSSERFYPGLNLSLYKNTRADTLMEQIRQENSAEERLTLAKDLHSTIQKSTPAIFLYTVPYIHLHTKKLRGLVTETKHIASPADRFENVKNWHVKTARVIKEK